MIRKDGLKGMLKYNSSEEDRSGELARVREGFSHVFE